MSKIDIAIGFLQDGNFAALLNKQLKANLMANGSHFPQSPKEKVGRKMGTFNCSVMNQTRRSHAARNGLNMNTIESVLYIHCTPPRTPLLQSAVVLTQHRAPKYLFF